MDAQPPAQKPERAPVRTGPLEIPLRIEASGPAPVELAWERYDRLELWPTWSPQLRSVSVDGGSDDGDQDLRLTAGLTGQVHGPLGVRAGFTILTLDPAQRRWSWLVRSGPLALRLEHGVDPAPSLDDRSDGSPGSRTWLVLHGPAPVVLTYAPIAWYALHRLVTL